MPRSAALLGATGLVGNHCLRLLLAEDFYDDVRILVRRRVPLEHPKLSQHVIDFDRMEQHSALLSAQDVFCCLGTTIKNAGSQEAFRKVDHDYPLRAAQLASQNGAEQFLIVTSMGANPHSSIFYSRVKGELEMALLSLPLRALHIFRPSLLLGKRNEFRLGERIGQSVMGSLSFAFVGPLKRYRPIEGKRVAEAMVAVAKKDVRGVHVYESEEVEQMGE